MRGAIYDAGMAPLERGGLAHRRRLAWSEVPRSGLGLEIGAGTGANFRFHPPGARLVVTDASPGMLARAAARARAAGVPLVACNAEQLPFRDDSFDWAAETLVFCQVPDPERGLREIARVLRPGGELVMLEHVRPAGMLGMLADWVSRVTVPLWGEHFDRTPEVPLRAAGFEIERRRCTRRGMFELLVARAPRVGSPSPHRS